MAIEEVFQLSLDIFSNSNPLFFVFKSDIELFMILVNLCCQLNFMLLLLISVESYL